MGRPLATVLALAALLAAGCGGGDSDSSLDTALSYLPKDAVFAVALDTDLDSDQYKALDALLDEFAFGDTVRNQIRQQLEQSTDGRFDEDLRPLLGNPLVVGAPSASGAATGPIAAIQVADEDKLDELVEREGVKELREAAGATLYQEDDTFFAVEDDVIAFAPDQRQLTAAVERADGDGQLDEDTFNDALDGLPEDALARIYADVEALLEDDPDRAAELSVRWIAALRTLGATVTARKDRLDADFRLRTEGDLSDADLPIAPGEEAPPVISREGELGLGIRDLAHIVRFAEKAAQSIDPAGFGDYAQAKKTIDKQLGVSLDDDLVGQLSGDLSASIALDGAYGVRAKLDDPQAFRRTLRKVSDLLPSFARGAGFGRLQLTKPRAGDDLYELENPRGGSVFFGVAGDALVVASTRPRAEELATEEPTPVPDAKGSVVVGADAEQLANGLIREFGAAFGVPDLGGLGAGLVTGPLDALNGHISASEDELRGRITLVIE